MTVKWKRFGIIAFTILALFIVGCTADDSGEEATPENGVETDDGQSVGEALDYTITGIDAGAGVVQGAERAVDDYGLDFNVQTSSSAAMTQALGDAIENEEAIVVTGWSPHWKFQSYDLKYLEDPEGSFGEAETINTVTRLGLEEDMPEAFQILDNFYWNPDDIEAVMLDISEGTEPEDAARTWIEDNEDRVSEWTDGVDEVDGIEIDIAYVAWETEIASTNVIMHVLSDMGYDVSITQVENGPMWNALASGNTDAIVAAWLPLTHADYYEDFKDDIDDLGPNLEGARIGLVVPEYMDIDSIGDLAE